MLTVGGDGFKILLVGPVFSDVPSDFKSGRIFISPPNDGRDNFYVKSFYPNDHGLSWLTTVAWYIKRPVVINMTSRI